MIHAKNGFRGFSIWGKKVSTEIQESENFWISRKLNCVFCSRKHPLLVVFYIVSNCSLFSSSFTLVFLSQKKLHQELNLQPHGCKKECTATVLLARFARALLDITDKSLILHCCRLFFVCVGCCCYKYS